MALDGVRALVFDTFGTVVDWYSGLAREAAGSDRSNGSCWSPKRFFLLFLHQDTIRRRISYA